MCLFALFGRGHSLWSSVPSVVKYDTDLQKASFLQRQSLSLSFNEEKRRKNGLHVSRYRKND